MRTQRRRPPHILWIIADQLTPSVLPCYGGSVVDSPHISRMADSATVFERAYCNSPLCAPSRASMLTGLLPSRHGAYDNGADFPSSIPTVAHWLAGADYRTVLAGKMHFVGPDQLHGFHERLTTDIFGAGYGATPDWRDPLGGVPWEVDAVATAGPSAATFQTEFDEEVTFTACRRLADAARSPQDGPLFLVASYTHPHDPFEPPPEQWARYENVRIDLPLVSRPSLEEVDPHSRRLRLMYGLDGSRARAFSDEQIRQALRAYYACVSFLDDQVGALLQTLDRTGLGEETIVVLSADHGEMLGERGLWYKLCWFEGAARVPIIVWDQVRDTPRRVRDIVSLMDMMPTILSWATKEDPRELELDGQTLEPLLAGRSLERADAAVGELLAEGLTQPQVMIRRGDQKFIRCPSDPDVLYDLRADPQERQNVIGDPAYASALSAMSDEADARWDLNRLAEAVRESQRRRRVVLAGLTHGSDPAWEYVPPYSGAGRYLTSSTDFWEHANRTRLAWPPPKPSEDSPAPIADGSQDQLRDRLSP